jgi:release factor glutamine methyltransferase
MELRQAQRQLTTDLIPLYGSREAALIADWVMENLTGRKKLDRLTNPTEPLPEHLLRPYAVYRSELLAHRPVQYVLQESWFAGLRFYVDESVLIPRPETEELVQWAMETIAPAAGGAASHSPTFPGSPFHPPIFPGAVFDVGTGSGCIAITLARHFPALASHACDISAAALRVASRNAATLGARIAFHHLDFLDRPAWNSLPPIQWLISNPPYIPEAERSTLAPHVADSEPALALFVPDADPLVFYQALADFGAGQLLPGGAVLAETHEDRTSAVAAIFRAAGAIHVEIRKDLMGKDRMIRASW